MCTKDRQLLFGRVENGMMQLSERFPITKLDEFVVMPDHLHGIILIAGQMELIEGLVLGGRFKNRSDWIAAMQYGVEECCSRR